MVRPADDSDPHFRIAVAETRPDIVEEVPECSHIREMTKGANEEEPLSGRLGHRLETFEVYAVLDYRNLSGIGFELIRVLVGHDDDLWKAPHRAQFETPPAKEVPGGR